MEEPEKDNLWIPGLSFRHLWKERGSDDSLNLSIMSSRCSAFFFSTLVSCQFLAHSCWDDEELYRPPKTQTFLSSYAIWLLFFFTGSQQKDISVDTDGVVFVWGGLGMFMFICLCNGQRSCRVGMAE